jgi:hypothetical protein
VNELIGHIISFMKGDLSLRQLDLEHLPHVMAVTRGARGTLYFQFVMAVHRLIAMRIIANPPGEPELRAEFRDLLNYQELPNCELAYYLSATAAS